MGKEDKMRLCGERMDWVKVSALFGSFVESFCQLEARLTTLGLEVCSMSTDVFW